MLMSKEITLVRPPPPKDQDFDVPNYITYQQSFVFSVKNPKPIFFGAKPHISQDLILTGLLPAPAWGLLTKSHFCWLDEKGCKAEHGNWFLLRKNFVMTRAQLRRMWCNTEVNFMKSLAPQNMRLGSWSQQTPLFHKDHLWAIDIRGYFCGENEG